MSRIILVLLGFSLASSTPLLPRTVTFGSGLPAPFLTVCAEPTVILNYTLTEGADLGVLDHFWITGDYVDDVIMEYYIDGEVEPSVAFEPSMACGQGFPDDTANPVAEGGIYSAGGKMGKAASQGGYYHKYKIPFGRSVIVTARTTTNSGCQYQYIMVRGYERSPHERGIVTSSGFEIPRSARMQLQVLPETVFPPLQLVSIANVSAGFSALLMQTAVATSSSPIGNNYIEGCWHLLRRASEVWPGLIVGTGYEDYFNSAYWFGAVTGFPNGLLYAQSESGLLHFSREGGVEQISAYRFLDGETMTMEDGGRLMFRIGERGLL